MKIALVGARNTPEELACTHWSGIDRTLEESEYEHKIFCCRQGDGFIAEIGRWKPDIIIYGLIDMAENQDWRKRIRFDNPQAKIAMWYTDCRTPATGQIPPVSLKETVDLFAVSNDGLKNFQKKHFGMDTVFVPQAVYPTPEPVFSQEVLDNYGNFVFIGGKINRGGFRPRMDLIVEIERRLGLRTINGVSKNERAMIYKAMPKIYGTAKFTLDIAHFWDVPKYTSNRFWVIPGMWGFPLTKRFPGCEELYPEDTRVYWDTVDELEEKMNYYRKHEDERKEMVRKGWQHTVDNHTYRHRIDKIIELLTK